MTLLASPGEPESLTLEAVPGKLDILASWQAVSGATSYKLRWRLSGGEFDADNAATATGDLWVITVPEYGQWEVRLQACNDAGCGPEANRTVNVVQELQVNLTPSQDNEGNPQRRTFTATWDPVPGAASYTLRWWREGEDPPTPSQPGGGGQSRAAAGPSGISGDNGPGMNQLTTPANQTSADFNVPDSRAYQAELQARGNNGVLIAQGDNHVNQAPGQPDTTPPRMVQGEIDGTTITLYFSEPLDEQAVGGHFTTWVNVDSKYGNTWRNGRTSQIEISGNKVTVRGNPRARAISRPWTSGAYVQYYPPTSSVVRGLRDLAGNRVLALTSYTFARIDNVTKPPYVTDVEVSSDAATTSSTQAVRPSR